MNRRSAKNLMITIFFVVLLILPLVLVRRTGAEVSQKENRILAAYPDILQEDGSFNPGLGRELKAWFEDHIGLRDQFVSLCANIKYHIFHLSPSEKVHIGKDGWFFYTMDENLEIASGTYRLTDEMLAQILAKHRAIRDKLKERGTDYVIVFPTSKVSIYPEYLRYGSGEVRKTPVDIVADYLENNSDLKVIRLKDILLDAKEGHQLYFKTDTHWTQIGAYIGYQEIHRRLTEMGLCMTPMVDATFEDAEYVGEFGAMMGVSLPAEPTVNTVFSRQATSGGTSSRAELFYKDISQIGIAKSCYYYEKHGTEGPRTMMYGDSMFGVSGGWNASNLLAENFPEFSYVWDWNIREKLLDDLQPELVIYEMTERYLNTFPGKNTEFLQTPLTQFSSYISGYEWNDRELRVTVANTGAEPWSFVNQIKLGVFSGGNDLGIRALIPAGIEVRPGESIDFTVSLQKWPELFSGNIEVGMLQEGIAYFPERVTVLGDAGSYLEAEILSHNTPETVSHTGKYTIDITVRNTGTVSWSEENGVRLCIWQDGVDWGYRLTLPPGHTVEPGGEYTFTLDNFVLPEAERTVLEYQMLQEGIQYFGEREAVEIAAV